MESTYFDNYNTVETRWDIESHIHVYLKTTRKLDIRSENFFDIGQYHGNYRSCRSARNVINYLLKGNDIISNFLDGMISQANLNAVQRVFMCNSFNEALEVVRSDYNLGRDYLRSSVGYEQNLRHIFCTNVWRPTVKPLFRLRCLPELVGWNPNKRALWLYGPDNTGKTTFALSLFNNPLLIMDPDKLKELAPEHDGIVFDNMYLGDYRVQVVENLLDMQFHTPVRIRYQNVIISDGLPRVFTSNKPIFP
ncbi:hypothetical protein BB560_004504 [Smittium megazygosporum]|uniref:Uncharacterized protein n=1 Tax=Smittium megazygosporum TaxID=133381 RepID=A0A2T9Z964_9FUNG|nr:hypothetical protein BB560_004504 [Smittium megazygosporum]